MKNKFYIVLTGFLNIALGQATESYSTKMGSCLEKMEKALPRTFATNDPGGISSSMGSEKFDQVQLQFLNWIIGLEEQVATLQWKIKEASFHASQSTDQKDALAFVLDLKTQQLEFTQSHANQYDGFTPLKKGFTGLRLFEECKRYLKKKVKYPEQMNTKTQRMVKAFLKPSYLNQLEDDYWSEKNKTQQAKEPFEITFKHFIDPYSPGTRQRMKQLNSFYQFLKENNH